MTTPARPIILKAHAKLTRSLRITGVRPDGFHLIDAEMVTLDFADTLTIDPQTRGLHIKPAATGLAVPATADNSVARALALVQRDVGVQIDKAIPAGAGLGGGSADAAAILRWANFDDPIQSATLGADVPFCVRGGRARVTGIGEIIEPLEDIDVAYTLLIPPLGCATPAVYAAWDALGGPKGPNGNDLEAAALHIEPQLGYWRDKLGDATGQTPTLAGSGSTWFVEGAYAGTGHIIARTTRAYPSI